MQTRNIIEKTAPSIEISIYMAGDVNLIRQSCMRYCAVHGFCVTVTPTEFIYSGGHEPGVKIGVVNYPRFTSDLGTLRKHAHIIARQVLKDAFQETVLVIDPEETRWFTRRKVDQAGPMD